MKTALIASAGLLAYGAYLLSTQEQGAVIDFTPAGNDNTGNTNNGLTATEGILSNISTGFKNMLSNWKDKLETTGKPYKAAFAAAEAKHGLPHNMLARLAWQESRYNPNAYNISGATGLMQIVPKWHPTVNPKDPYASIDYAGKFLASLYKSTGTWELALKSYNWGLGNVQKWLRGKLKEPLETKLYSAQILSDLTQVA